MPKIVEFYVDKIKANIWLDQGKCVILQHGNMLFGFCEGDKSDNCGIITFFYTNASEVNLMYQSLSAIAELSPRVNHQYRIYHFFAQDPEGRKIEFQTFLHRLNEYWSGSELLFKRRSIRQFSPDVVDDKVIHKIMELCRYSPTSRNSQSYYYVITRNKSKIEVLSKIRDTSSKPLAEAPLVIAVCADLNKTKRPQQDACIAAYHLLLAATQYGLGTCWITDMDRTEVKDILNIPSGDYIACLTPLGYPIKKYEDYSKEELQISTTVDGLPERRDITEIFRFE
ncbi:MAG: nitroreductase family protein [Candidatus Cloacimonetes bacterium]|nr:nitroreductase family protein [Candidatus Cloacimonadota bacterium]